MQKQASGNKCHNASGTELRPRISDYFYKLQPIAKFKQNQTFSKAHTFLPVA